MEKLIKNDENLGRELLIPILQEIQKKKGYLSREDIIEISKRMNISTAKIYGVASFYNQFKFTPPGKYHIQVCRGTACHVKGSAEIMHTLLRTLEIDSGETTKDGLFSVEVVACVGACSLAPVMAINGKYHAKLKVEDVEKIIKHYREKDREDYEQL